MTRTANATIIVLYAAAIPLLAGIVAALVLKNVDPDW